MPKIFTRMSLVAAFALLLASAMPSRGLGQGADHVIVLLNARNPTGSLTRAQLRNIYLGKTAFWHGVVPIKVFVRPPGSAAAKVFFDPILGKTPQAFTKHWDKLQLAGRGVAPKVVGSPAKLATGIAQQPGGIGFALASEAWHISGVKTVSVK